MVQEPRHGWLAHHHYPLNTGSAGPWHGQQTVKPRDDEVASSGDSACCEDDDVNDEQVREVKTRRHDVSNDDSSTNHCQPQHCRKPAGS